MSAWHTPPRGTSSVTRDRQARAEIGGAVGLNQHRSFGIEYVLAAQYGLIGHCESIRNRLAIFDSLPDLSPNTWRSSCGMPESGIPVALAWRRPWLARGEPQVHRRHDEQIDQRGRDQATENDHGHRVLDLLAGDRPGH